MWPKDIVEEITSWLDLKSLICWSRVSKYYYNLNKQRIYNRIKTIPKRLVCYTSLLGHKHVILYIGYFPDGSHIDRDTDDMMIVDVGLEWFVTIYNLDLDFLPKSNLITVGLIWDHDPVYCANYVHALIPIELSLDDKLIILMKDKSVHNYKGKVIWGHLDPTQDRLHKNLPNSRVLVNSDNYYIIVTTFIIIQH
jgi:hypothetical protein